MLTKHERQRWTRRRRSSAVVLTGLLLGTMAVLLAPTSAAAVGARPHFQLPFPCGQLWRLDTWGHAPALDMVKEPDQHGTEGALLVAPAGGTVSLSIYHSGSGNVVQINHGGGWFTTMIHLQSRAVSAGDRVQQGQTIGRVGKTGTESNDHSHLHMEQAIDSNGDGRVGWAKGSERVRQYFNGVDYGVTNNRTWRNVRSQNCRKNIPLAGDWDGDGRDTIGVYRPGDRTFYLRNSNTGGSANITATFGTYGDIPIVGDWTNNNTDTIGVYRPSESKFYFRNSNSGGAANYSFTYGRRGDVPLIGDWNGDGTDTVGVFRPSNRTFYLKNVNAGGAADIVFAYGTTTDKPVVGNWNNDSKDTIGIYRPSTSEFHLRNANSGGAANITFRYGRSGDLPVMGDWDRDSANISTVGVYRPSERRFYLRNSNSGGDANIVFNYG